MSGALRDDWSTGRLFSPETIDPAGTILMKYGALLNQREDEKAARAAKEVQLAESKRQFDTTVGFKEREEKRAIDELNRTQNKELAQNEALKAVLNPSAYSTDKVRNERAAMEQSIAGLSPREQDSIRSRYDPTASGRGWVDSATGSSLVDQVKLMSAKDADYKMKATTPGTPEYEAIKKAQIEDEDRKIDKELNLFKQKEALKGKSEMDPYKRMMLLKEKDRVEEDILSKRGYGKELGIENPEQYSLEYLKDAFKSSKDKKDSPDKIADVLSGINTDNWIAGDRRDALKAVTDAKTKGYSSKDIADAIKISTDEDKDFDLDSFISYLDNAKTDTSLIKNK
jgi:hypothetical protein